MASKKKLLTSVVALGTAAALTLGGTFAWQSISQTATNEASDIVNPGGRLHNDLYYVDDLKTDANIYVENFAEDDIYARVRLSEYMEVVMNYGTDAEVVTTIAGEKTPVDGSGQSAENASQKDAFKYTYDTHYFGQENDTDEFFTWQHADEDTAEDDLPYYMPTFNKNKDSLKADLHGLYMDRVGGISNRSEEQYTDDPWAEDSKREGFEIYDGDSNTLDELEDLSVDDMEMLIEGGEKAFRDAEVLKAVKLVDATGDNAHKATKGLISMSKWLALNGGTYSAETHGSYWVYDDSADGDGWVYWSSPIKAGETTGLLLDGFELKGVMDDTWYYAIDVEAQFVTANDVGKGDNSGFYADGETVTENAEELLKNIGVEMSAGEQPDEDETEKVLTVSNGKLNAISDSSLEYTADLKINGEAVTGEHATADMYTPEGSKVGYVTGTIEDGTVTFYMRKDNFEQTSEVVPSYYLEITYQDTDTGGNQLTAERVEAKYAETLTLNSDGAGTLPESGLERIVVWNSGEETHPDEITVASSDAPLTKDTDYTYNKTTGLLTITKEDYMGKALTVEEYVDPTPTTVAFYHGDTKVDSNSTDFKVGVEDTLTLKFYNSKGQQITKVSDVASIMEGATFTLKSGETAITDSFEAYGWSCTVNGSDLEISIDQDYIDDLTFGYNVGGITGTITLTPDFTGVYGAKEANFLKLIPNDCNAGIPLNETYYLYLDQDDKGTKWITEDIFKDGTVTGTFDGFGVLTDTTLTFVSNDDGTYSGICDGTTICTVSCGDKRNAGITLLRGSRGTWCLTIKIDEQTYACRFTTAS